MKKCYSEIRLPSYRKLLSISGWLNLLYGSSILSSFAKYCKLLHGSVEMA
jgi:hypothetical protein